MESYGPVIGRLEGVSGEHRWHVYFGQLWMASFFRRSDARAMLRLHRFAFGVAHVVCRMGPGWNDYTPDRGPQ